MPRTRAKTRKLKPDSDLAHRSQIHGERSLTDAELVALIGGLDIQHAVELLRGTGGLARLRINIDTALPEASLTAARLKASLELSKRMLRAKLPAGKLLNRPSAVAKYLTSRYWIPDQEIVGAVLLDDRLRLIDDLELFRGSEARCQACPKPFLRHALRLEAHALLMFHTHTSTGEVRPSEDDLGFTERLHEACDAAGFYLVDHMILGGEGGWCSMRQEGHFPQG